MFNGVLNVHVIAIISNIVNEVAAERILKNENF